MHATRCQVFQELAERLPGGAAPEVLKLAERMLCFESKEHKAVQEGLLQVLAGLVTGADGGAAAVGGQEGSLGAREGRERVAFHRPCFCLEESCDDEAAEGAPTPKRRRRREPKRVSQGSGPSEPGSVEEIWRAWLRAASADVQLLHHLKPLMPEGADAEAVLRLHLFWKDLQDEFEEIVSNDDIATCKARFLELLSSCMGVGGATEVLPMSYYHLMAAVRRPQHFAVECKRHLGQMPPPFDRKRRRLTRSDPSTVPRPQGTDGAAAACPPDSADAVGWEEALDACHNLTREEGEGRRRHVTRLQVSADASYSAKALMAVVQAFSTLGGDDGDRIKTQDLSLMEASSDCNFKDPSVGLDLRLRLVPFVDALLSRLRRLRCGGPPGEDEERRLRELVDETAAALSGSLFFSARSLSWAWQVLRTLLRARLRCEAAERPAMERRLAALEDGVLLHDDERHAALGASDLMLLLGQTWPALHGRLAARLSADGGATLQDPVFLQQLNCGALRLLLPDSAQAVRDFRRRLRQLSFQYAPLTCKNAKSLMEQALRPGYFLTAAERACWQDRRALELLHHILTNEHRGLRLAPFNVGLRAEQLLRELGARPDQTSFSIGNTRPVVLLWCPSSFGWPSSKVLTRLPLPLRVFAKATAPFFRVLPVGPWLRLSEVAGLVRALRGLDVQYYLTGHTLFYLTNTSEHELFSRRSLVMKVGESCTLPDLLSEFRHQSSAPSSQSRDEELRRESLLLVLGRMVSHVFQARYSFLAARLRELHLSVAAPPAASSWRDELRGLVGEAARLHDDIRVVIFCDEARVPAAIEALPGVQLLPLPFCTSQPLLAHLRQARLPIFRLSDVKEARWSRLGLLAEGAADFSPVYKFGDLLTSSWEEQDVRLLRKHVSDDASRSLLLAGVKAVVFSDRASGLLCAELACRLPLRLAAQPELLEALSRHDVALYTVDVASGSAPCTRRLTLEQLFCPWENLYDHELLHRPDEAGRDNVKTHVLTELGLRVPRQLAAAAAGSDVVPKVLLFALRGAALGPWAESFQRVELTTGRAPRRLSEVHVGFARSRRCRGFESGGRPCTKPATRGYMRQPVVCDACSPWQQALPASSNLVCQHQDAVTGDSCDRAAVVECLPCSLAAEASEAPFLRDEQDEQDEDAPTSSPSPASPPCFPRRLCAEHQQALRRFSQEELDGLCLDPNGPLLYREPPASLDVPGPWCWGEARETALPPLKHARPLFEEPVVTDECLEVELVIEERLRDFFLREGPLQPDGWTGSVLLGADAAVCRLLRSAWRSCRAAGSPVILDAATLLTLKSADLQRFLCTGGVALPTVQPLVGVFAVEAASQRLLHGVSGELRPESFFRAQELVKREEAARGPPLAGGTVRELLPNHLRALLELRVSPNGSQCERIAATMLRLKQVVDVVLQPSPRAARPKLLTMNPSQKRGGATLEDVVELGWCCVTAVWSQTDGPPTKGMRHLSKGDLVELRLEEALVWWHRHAGVHLSGILKTTTPPVWADVISLLAYPLDRDDALASLKAVDAAFAALFQRASCPSVAVGLASSICRNLMTTLQTSRTSAVVPHGLIKDMIEPRVASLPAFEELLFKLFQDPREQGQGRKLPLFIRHVFGLAQVYYWSAEHRRRLEAAVNELALTALALGADARLARDLDAIFPMQQGQVTPAKRRGRGDQEPLLDGALVDSKLMQLNAKYSQELRSPGAPDEAPVGAPDGVADVQGRGAKRARTKTRARDVAEVPA